MALKIADFKKTTRKSGDERLLYPYQIRDDRYTASISYAISYYERMLGRRRAEFETETLLEFFGDARLARGLVACLSRSYIWREQTLGDEFGEPVAQVLRKAGLATPAAFRARLYGLANGRYGGVILPHERAEALDQLCATLPITPAQFERALALDAEEQHLLVKIGPTPEPQEIVARYNYHSLETALCHAEQLRLSLRGPIWSMIRSAHNLARRYRLRYEVTAAPRTLFDEQLGLTLYGSRDALGSWMRTGRRMVRALLRLLASHPDCLLTGEAIVHLRGQTTTLRLDERALRVLGIAAHEEPEESEPWEEDSPALFGRAWGNAFVGGRTSGWRLRRDPEPLIGAGTVVVPDFVLYRGQERLALCLASSRSVSESLLRDLGQLGRRIQAVAIVPAAVAETLRTCPVPLATYADQPVEAIPALISILERRYPRPGPQVELTPWQRLEQLIATEGFASEATVANVLGCTLEEAPRIVQRWGGPALHVLPGLGVCTPELLNDIRQLIEQGEITQHAA